MASFELLIFDMDDTLVASAETWKCAESRLFQLLGTEYDVKIADGYKGMNAAGVGRVIWEQLRPAGMSTEECCRLLREVLLEEFRKPLRPMAGADRLLRAAGQHFPLAIASGSPLEAIQLVLAQFAWTPLVPLAVSSESVPHGKPAPDVFLETARRFGCSPERTLVFEDSLHGVRAAKRAGMTCFTVPSSNDPRIGEEADRCFHSLEEVTLESIRIGLQSS